MKNLLILLTIPFLFLSCLKDEIAIPKLDRGDAIIQSTKESTYSHQLYFDLETNSFVKYNNKVDWDIAFGCGEHKELIFSNTSKNVRVARALNANFADVTSSVGYEFATEASTGNPDSNAFKGWNYDDVYIIDLGYDDKGVAQGFGKIKLIENNAVEATFQYGMLADAEPKTATVAKDINYNAIFFSIKNSGVADIEPPKDDWDLCFTQYVFYFFDFEQHYLVSGVLLNRSNVAAYRHASKNYADINFDNISPEDFSPYLDAIGYNWKVFNNVDYEVFSDFNYIINSTEGFYFKLHFTSFYDNLGEKGFPKFEFQKI